MDKQSTIHSTFVIEHSYPKPPDTVFAAFADPVKKRRWFGDSDHLDVEEYEMDFRVGGAEQIRYRFKEGTPFPGVALANEGCYLDIVLNQRIVTASSMALGDKRISASLVTIELLPNAQSTDLICTNQGIYFEGADGPKMRQAGWQTLFDKLSQELAR